MFEKVKRVLAVVLSVLLVLTLVACGGGGKTPADESSPTAQASPDADKGTDGKFTMGVIVKFQVPWFDRLAEGVARYAEETGNDVFVLAPTAPDAAQQVQMVEDLIAQQVDVIGIIPNSPDALEEVLQKARDQGIKVVSHEAPTLKNIDVGVEAFTDEDFGEFLMEAMAQKMGGEGEYATIIESLTNTNHNTWTDAAIAYQEANYPDMVCVSSKNETKGDVSQAQSVTEELLKSYPNVKGIMGTGSADVPGACLAIENRGLSGQIAVVGCTSPQDAKQYLDEGTCTMIGLWDPAETGYAMCVLANMLMEGKGDQIVNGLDLGMAGFENCSVIDGKYVISSAMLGIYAGDDVDKYPF